MIQETNIKVYWCRTPTGKYDPTLKKELGKVGWGYKTKIANEIGMTKQQLNMFLNGKIPMSKKQIIDFLWAIDFNPKVWKAPV